ncbi:hypothetical protein [Leifsonia sp. Leaf264]|uniref:hypothetical protein n=1 Tax=Leifsonia sp. Leaf264 TaxID=1736314 RepID=UPI0006FB20FB|nr:hypothetical protein [Leifsonia sp. Leaf264]KQP01856.1 hypothetical protein ASF30_04665 [Leifsonia sp. Leaf264]
MSGIVLAFIWTGAVVAAIAFIVIIGLASRRRRLSSSIHDPEMQQSLDEIQSQIDSGRGRLY